MLAQARATEARRSAPAASAAAAAAAAALVSSGSNASASCSTEALVAVGFTHSLGNVHFCATNHSSAEDVLRDFTGYSEGERRELLRWATAAAIVGFGLVMLLRVRHLVHAYPTVFSLSLNTVSSVGLIFTNKVLYQRGCDYAVTLVGMNFAATSSVNLCVKRDKLTSAGALSQEIKLYGAFRATTPGRNPGGAPLTRTPCSPLLSLLLQ